MFFQSTKKISFLGLGLLVSLSLHAQVTFFASASPAAAAKDEYITFSLRVMNGGDVKQIVPPSFSDFTVVSGPVTEMGMNNLNGATSQYQGITYTLLPKKPGSFRIGAATASVNGKLYQSKPLTILVSNRTAGTSHGSAPSLSTLMQMPVGVFDMPAPAPRSYDDYLLRDGEDAHAKALKNMQLRLITDKTSCYVGEPVLATYKLYTRLECQSELAKSPSFNGFSVVDMTEDELDSKSTETLAGRPYTVYVIRKAQLFPLRAGPVTLEAATLDNKAEFLRNNGSGAPMVTEDVTLSSAPLTINVKPLPDDGKPANFSGAVGNFTITATAEKYQFSTDETGKLLVQISGEGNMLLLTKPAVAWPAGIETFDAKITDDFVKTTIPLSGTKTFAIPFTADKAGEYNIPPVSFSFFNPANGSYKTILSAPVSFHISTGSGIKKNLPAAANDQPSVSMMNSFFSRRWLIILLLAGIIISSIILWMRKESNAQAQFEIAKEREADIPAATVMQMPAGNPLSRAEDCMHRNDCREFYTVLGLELREFLAARFSLPENFAVKNIGAVLDKAGISNEIALQTQALLQAIDSKLYMPFEDDEKLQHIYADAQALTGLLGRTS